MIRLKKLKSVRRRQSSLREQMWLHGHSGGSDVVTSSQDPLSDTPEPSAETPSATEQVT
jgi:hypothetical protein